MLCNCHCSLAKEMRRVDHCCRCVHCINVFCFILWFLYFFSVLFSSPCIFLHFLDFHPLCPWLGHPEQHDCNNASECVVFTKTKQNNKKKYCTCLIIFHLDQLHCISHKKLYLQGVQYLTDRECWAWSELRVTALGHTEELQ